jgi:precorrin-6B methylase 2
LPAPADHGRNQTGPRVILALQSAIAALIVGTLFVLVRTSLGFAPFVPSRRVVIEKALDLACVGPGIAFVDLGSGDGRVVIEAARRGAVATGVERVWLLWLLSHIRATIAGQPARFLLADLWQVDIGDADVIFAYGTPSALRDHFAAHVWERMKPGSRLVCAVYRVSGIPASEHSVAGTSVFLSVREREGREA